MQYLLKHELCKNSQLRVQKGSFGEFWVFHIGPFYIVVISEDWRARDMPFWAMRADNLLAHIESDMLSGN